MLWLGEVDLSSELRIDQDEEHVGVRLGTGTAREQDTRGRCHVRKGVSLGGSERNDSGLFAAAPALWLRAS